MRSRPSPAGRGAAGTSQARHRSSLSVQARQLGEAVPQLEESVVAELGRATHHVEKSADGGQALGVADVCAQKELEKRDGAEGVDVAPRDGTLHLAHRILDRDIWWVGEQLYYIPYEAIGLGF